MTDSSLPPKQPPNKKRILVVDDDEVFRKTLCQTLLREGYEILQSAKGEDAVEIIKTQTVDAVISDINMPTMNGIELMKLSRQAKPIVPVILMTGFSGIKETKEAFDLGARGFLPKPFKKDELLSILNKWLNSKVGEIEEESQDANFCKLSIDDFISGHEIKHDIYIRLSEKKYLKIAHEGEDIPRDRINVLKSKNIRYLYMRNEAFKKYMGTGVALLQHVKGNASVSKEKKNALLKHTNEVIMEYVFLNGVDESGFHSAKALVESTVSILAEAADMMKILTMLNSHSDSLYAHCLGVSVYAVMISKKLGWHLPASNLKIAMGGLLHDIGKKDIPREITDKQRKDMSAEEVRLYESHPKKGMEILSQVPEIPSDVLEIVMQHHEDCNGLGFPAFLNKKHIHPMARVVAVANEFCDLVLKGPVTLNMTPSEAIQKIHTTQKEKLDPQFIDALAAIFSVPVAGQSP